MYSCFGNITRRCCRHYRGWEVLTCNKLLAFVAALCTKIDLLIILWSALNEMEAICHKNTLKSICTVVAVNAILKISM